MSSFLIIISILLFLVAGSVFFSAKSVLHEILASVILIISAIFFCSGAIVNAIEDLPKKSKELEK